MAIEQAEKMESLAFLMLLCSMMLLCNQIDHIYDAQKRDLLWTVNTVFLANDLSSLSNEALVQIILYRDERLPNDINNEIIKATQNYIHTSYHF